MIAIDLPYCYTDRDRHGNVRVYFFRRGGPKVRMREPIGSESFMARYRELVEKSFAGQLIAETSTSSRKPLPGTWRALCVDYFISATFQRLDPSTQRVRRRLLELTFEEPIAPGTRERFGDMPVARFTAKAVKVLRDRKSGLPEAANARVKAIRQVFAWALEEEWSGARANPARDVAYVRSGSTGHHSWTVEEVAQYEARHPIGTTARLALALLLLTGVRRSDVVRLGRQHARDGWLRFTQTKGARRAPMAIEIPILPELQRILDASQVGDLTFLVNSFGVPFTAAGFGNWFRARCDEAGLKHCSAHGLRKAGAAIAAENGATDHQLMAIFGWRTMKEAQRYTRAARRRLMAESGMPLLARRDRNKA